MPRLILIALLIGLLIYLLKTTFSPPKPKRIVPVAFRVPGEMLNLLFSVGEQLFQQLNLDALLSQKETLDRDVFSRLSEVMSTHPYILKRVFALKAFEASELYAKIVKRNDALAIPDP